MSDEGHGIRPLSFEIHDIGMRSPARLQPGESSFRTFNGYQIALGVSLAILNGMEALAGTDLEVDRSAQSGKVKIEGRPWHCAVVECSHGSRLPPVASVLNVAVAGLTS